MAKRSASFIVVLYILIGALNGQEISEFIHLDQFGYLIDAEKVAVISDPQVGYNSDDAHTPGNTLEVRSSLTGEIVYSGPISVWNSGNTHDQSGDAGWWFDFSSVSAPGTYYIYDPQTDHRSASFEISSDPYIAVIRAALKAFYYNRCNSTKEVPFAQSNWTDIDNFPQDAAVRDAFDQNNASTAKDLTGGWFDAGDYNKYVTFAHDPVHQLLSAYEENPALFTDAWNIPESGDGIPDILNEVIWELDWLRKMINADGTVHIKMGSLNYDINDNAPPSANNAPRYYAPTCSSASLAIASMFAHAAKVLKSFPNLAGYSTILESNALLCWNRFLSFFNSTNLQFECDDITVKAGDADWNEQTQINNAIVAAVYLFDLTGEGNFSNFVADNVSNTEPVVDNFIAPHHPVLLEAMLKYTTLDNVDQTTENAILTLASDAITNNWGNYFDFSTDDLYRAAAPDWVYYWGSNMQMANIGNLCHILNKYDVLPWANPGLLRKAAEHLHYFHGVNPQGIVYLTNMYQFGGDRCANEIFHTWFNDGTDWDNALTSTYGPAPGFLSGGPNQGYTGSLSPPAGQPVQKCYLDYNNGYSDVAYEITEPAIYYQAAYIRFLAHYVSDPTVTSTTNLEAIKNCISIYPNPTDDYFRISGNLDGFTVQILTETGSVYREVTTYGSDVIIDISGLPSGLLFIKVQDSNNSMLGVEKILKVD